MRITFAVRHLIKNGAEKGRRSEAIASVITSLLKAGYEESVVFEIFNTYPIGEKYQEKGHGKGDWLKAEISRLRMKFVGDTNTRVKPEKGRGFSLKEIQKKINT